MQVGSLAKRADIASHQQYKSQLATGQKIARSELHNSAIALRRHRQRRCGNP
jgi:hypothetical protein